MKKFLSGLLSAALAASLLAPSAAAVGTGFTDVPAGSSLAGEVEKAVDCGLMNGYDAGTFGYGDSMTRAQFVTVLGRMMGWSDGGAHVAMWMIPEAMEVPSDLSETYLFAIEQAAQRDVVDIDEPFRPSDPVTRGEMAELLVRALGLKGAAEQVRQLWASRDSAFTAAIPFTDVTGEEAPYIQIAYTIGMTNGTSATTFSPGSTATRAQAAAMLVRIYEKITAPTGPVHGFYSISSYSQLDLAGDMDAVSAGWSRMTWDGETAVLRTTSADGNEYAIPSGYEEVTDYLSGRDVPLHLSVFMEGQELKDLLASPDGRAQAVEQIVHEVTVDYQTIGENPYSGVTIDFEGLRQGQKADFTAFLTALDAELEDLGKELYVCVSPVLAGGTYYDGYDYAAIGRLADKVILMAYGYDARDMSGFVGSRYHETAATAPIGQVYLGLAALTEQVDPDKVLLGFSAQATAWQIDGEGDLLSGTPVYPSAETVARRLAQPDTEKGWSGAYQQPYAVYTTEDGGRYFLWYQDSASVEAAMRAAKLLGVAGASVWRLGMLPDSEVWNWDSLLG